MIPLQAKFLPFFFDLVLLLLNALHLVACLLCDLSGLIKSLFSFLSVSPDFVFEDLFPLVRFPPPFLSP